MQLNPEQSHEKRTRLEADANYALEFQCSARVLWRGRLSPMLRLARARPLSMSFLDPACGEMCSCQDSWQLWLWSSQV